MPWLLDVKMRGAFIALANFRACMQLRIQRIVQRISCWEVACGAHHGLGQISVSDITDPFRCGHNPACSPVRLPPD